VRTVDFWRGDSTHKVEINDEDLVLEFDAGMDLAPWLDWVAERYPDLLWAAEAYGRLMAGGAA
jgi:hypothetical protein